MRSQVPSADAIPLRTKANELGLGRAGLHMHRRPARASRAVADRRRRPYTSVVAVDAVVVARPPVSAAGFQRAVPKPAATAAVGVGAVSQWGADEGSADVPVPEGRYSGKARPRYRIFAVVVPGGRKNSCEGFSVGTKTGFEKSLLRHRQSSRGSRPLGQTGRAGPCWPA